MPIVFQGDRYAEIVVPAGGSFNEMIEATGKGDVGDRMNKINNKLVEANGLTGIVEVADFEDS